MIIFAQSELTHGDAEALLYTRDVCREFECKPKDVYKLVHSGQLDCIKVGGKFRFEKKDVRRIK